MSFLPSVSACPCCGNTKFATSTVLWQSLIDEWRLASYEVDYINRQQGLHCENCKSSLRSMALALTIMKCFGYEGLFKDFVLEQAQKLKILEINEAGQLTSFLSQVPGHVLTSYPEVDVMQMPFADGSFDLVVHSDILEHVKYPIKALSECYRVLKPGKFLAVTLPMIVDRLTSSREGLSPSYHAGAEDINSVLVYTEYGCDAWKHVIQAGFHECRIYSLDYPSAQVLVGVKLLSAYIDNIDEQLQEVELGLRSQNQQLQAQSKEAQSQIKLLQTEWEQSQSQLQQTQTELEHSQSQLQQTQTELEHSQSQLQQTQTELEHSQSQLQQTQTELEHSQSQLQQTQTELEHSQSQLQQTQIKLQECLSEIQQTQVKFGDSQGKSECLKSQLEQSQAELEKSQSQLQITESSREDYYNELELRRAEVRWMKSSRFWKLKELFSAFKALLHSQKQFLFHIDSPNSQEIVGSDFQISGWCISTDTIGIKAARAKVGKTIFYGTYGISRLDVAQAYGNIEGSESSGFEIPINLYPGKYKIRLDVLDIFDKWHVLASFSVTVVTLEVDSSKQWSLHLMAGSKKFLKPWGKKLKELAKLANNVRKQVLEKQRQLGRIPSLQEIPKIARWLKELYQQQNGQMSALMSPVNFVIPPLKDPYEAWLAVNQWNEKASNHLKYRLKTYQGILPKISVVMPVFNPPIHFLDYAIASVVNQVYENWELCIADDRSTDPAVHLTLNDWTAKDHRVRVIFREENGNISAATNSAASLASGDFLLFLDHDDELSPDALGEVALNLAEHPKTDFLYSDDDKIDSEGRRFAPQFKPDWSPELLLSYMYLSHVCLVRRSIFEQVGGLRVGFEGSQDYDFTLRATEISRQVSHLPLVLYHWRAVPGSTAVSGAAKPASFTAGQKALQEAFARRGISGCVYQPEWAVKSGVGIFEHEFPDTGPSVAIIIPTKNRVDLLSKCVSSLKKTTYQNYQIVIIDNESDDKETIAYLESLPHKVLRIKNPDTGFNFAAINNRAAEQVKSDYILFLNNDTEVISPQWLSQMMGFAKLHGVGAVGARLLYPDQKIQHAGIIHGMYHGLAGPAFKTSPSWNYGYLSYAKVTRNYSAVTAACLLTPQQLFLELGGFDEVQFAVAYNDVDYCYRLVERGYRCVYCANAELTHKEGSSRGFGDNPREPATFKRQYGDKIDPWYSPYLSLSDEQFRIQPRRVVIGSLPPIRTLIFTHNLNWEGAPNSQYELTVQLKETGVIDPIVYSPKDGPLRQDYEKKGITVHLKEHPLKNVCINKDYNKAISVLAEFIQKFGVDLIYANTLQTFYAIAAAELLGIPSIWNVRESEPWQTYFNDFGLDIAARALECFQFPYRVVFVADATRDKYFALNSHNNFTVIHNGLNLERLEEAGKDWTRQTARRSLKITEDEVVLLLLGTVCERKGQQDLPLALAKLSSEWYGKVKVFIVGDRPSLYSMELQRMIAKLPEALRSSVTVVPETSDTARYYKAADILIFTSRIESFPRVILEAMSYGLPIITTPVFGVQEQVQEGVNALIYEPGNVKELAEAIACLLKDQDMRSRLAKNSPHVLNCLNSFKDMVKDYTNIFQEAYFTCK